MKDKLYIFADNCKCYTENWFKNELREQGWDEMTVEETKPMYRCEWFWCTVHEEMMERNDGFCGKECKDYDPRNGKSGICKHNTFLREGTGKFKTIKL